MPRAWKRHCPNRDKSFPEQLLEHAVLVMQEELQWPYFMSALCDVSRS